MWPHSPLPEQLQSVLTGFLLMAFPASIHHAHFTQSNNKIISNFLKQQKSHQFKNLSSPNIQI